jgi:uncharacterized protein YneF (UPF0154 family)
MALKNKVSILIIILVVVFLLFLTVGNYVFARCFSGDEILNEKLSSKAKAVKCMLDAWGRERKYYSFYAVYQGNTNELFDITLMLNLKRVKMESKPLIDMNKYRSESWWNPPSISTNLNYVCFEKEIRDENAAPQKLLKCRAELISNTLFIQQVGDIKSLRKQLKKNSNLKRFML